MTHPKEQAFPCLDLTFAGEHLVDSETFPGLTKREYFATAAMQALLSNPSIVGGYEYLIDRNFKNIASYAAAAAYFLEQELNK